MYNLPLPFFKGSGSSTQASEKDNEEISLKEIKKEVKGFFAVLTYILFKI